MNDEVERRRPHPELIELIGDLKTTMAVTGERVQNMQEDVGSIKGQLDKHDDRLTNVERKGYKMMGGLAVIALVWGWVSKHITF